LQFLDVISHVCLFVLWLHFFVSDVYDAALMLKMDKQHITIPAASLWICFKIYDCETSKSKVKLSRYTPWRHTGGEEVQLLLILNLGTRWGWVVSVTPRPHFTPGERNTVIRERDGSTPLIPEPATWYCREPVTSTISHLPLKLSCPLYVALYRVRVIPRLCEPYAQPPNLNEHPFSEHVDTPPYRGVKGPT
jgi:hypothetical protein